MKQADDSEGEQMITDAQAETIRVLDAQFGAITNGINFSPLEFFPARNNEDNGHRRTLTTLKRAGYFIDEPHQPGRLRPVADKLRAAYREWYQKRGFRFDN